MNQMFHFFASPQTLEVIKNDTSQKVILIGGFNGFWNFGDLLQLRGVLRWYQHNRVNDLLCPLHELTTTSGRPRLGDLERLFETNHWLFYSTEESSESCRYADSLGLRPLDLAELRVPAMLHVYGGGFFNGFWGNHVLCLIETIIRFIPLKHYVISGQQVGQEFAAELAAHCLRYHPTLVGGRDELSVSVLQERGIAAQLSGDDALDELLFYCGKEDGSPARPENAETFGMHLNISSYVATNAGGGQENEGQDLLQSLDDCFQLLEGRFGASRIPLVVNAYSDQRDCLQDSWTSLKKTSFTNYFPICRGIDLVGLLTQGRLSEAVVSLRGLSRFITTSYHTSLFLKALRVPTLLLAFNDYYRQKLRGLGENPQSLPEFLSEDPQQILAQQNSYLLTQEQCRSVWWKSVGRVLDGVADHPGSLERMSRLLERAQKTLAAVTNDRDRFQQEMQQWQAEAQERQKEITIIAAERDGLRQEKQQWHSQALEAKQEIETFRRSRLLRRIKALQESSSYKRLWQLMSRVMR